MPSDNAKKLEWIKAINRETLPKRVFVCSEHFLDGVPTDRNPYPKVKMVYETKQNTRSTKTAKQNTDFNVKKRKLLEADELSDIGDVLGSSILSTTSRDETEKYPEVMCSFNVVPNPTTCTLTM